MTQMEHATCEWRDLTLAIASLMAQTPELPDELLSGRDGMLGAVAAQLEAPVAVLRAQVQQLDAQAAEHGQSAAPLELVSHIVEQADRMAAWVGAILDVQRIRMGKVDLHKTQIDLAELTRTCIDDLDAVGLEIRVAPTTAQARVRGDRPHLAQAVRSMLDNAAICSAGAAINVRCGVYPWADGHPRAVLCVSDAGRELDVAELVVDLAGKPSDTPDLSIYVAREIARVHGGDLWAEPRGPGCGSSAVLVLPLDFKRRSHVVLARPE
jgi:K+-sensing histidine kinase KdpD